MSRRDFIRRTAVTTASAGLALSAAQAPEKAFGASDKLGVGVIGMGRMGRYNLEDFAKQPDVEIAVVCDVFAPNLEAGLKG